MADPSRTASVGDGLDGLKRAGLPASAHQRRTMQEELNVAPPEYELVAMTVFRSRFGGSEAAAILEAEAESEP